MNIESVFGPLKDFLEDKTQTISEKLIVLPLLAIRFKFAYTDSKPVVWNPFRIEVDTFHKMVDGKPADFVKIMTFSDKGDFDRLSPAAFKCQGEHLIYLD